MSKIVEHVVLFKLKADADSSKVQAMVDGINGLKSLDQVLHLTAGPIHRFQSPSPPNFTQMLHGRYKSKEDLTNYLAHPDHQRVGSELCRPVVEDVMAVDWVVDQLDGPVGPPPGSAIRFTFFKVKGGLGDEQKKEALAVVDGIAKNCLGSSDQITFGENFLPARGQGYWIGLLSVYSDMKSLEASGHVVKVDEEKVRKLVDDVVALDYVIPPP